MTSSECTKIIVRNAKLTISRNSIIYIKCTYACTRISSQTSPKDYLTKKAIFIPTYLPISVTICNKTIADDKILPPSPFPHSESRIAISGLTS